MNREETVTEAWRLVRAFFGPRPSKAILWWVAKNPLLGDFSPREMVDMGREDKLLKFVRQQLSDGEGDES